jgi:NAD(P)-dependent dehydrogenase (short-subunit alcohol dehydrogenase family)
VLFTPFITDTQDFFLALWAVVNNAGIATFGEMEWMTSDMTEKIFNVNIFGPIAITKAFLPLLRISRGRVIIVSSLAGMILQIYKVQSNSIYILTD